MVIGFSRTPDFLTPTMATFTANADYEEKDSDPIKLTAGDEITVGLADRAWPGWVWATDNNGNDGYVPEEILEPLGEGRYAAMDAYEYKVTAQLQKETREILGYDP